MASNDAEMRLLNVPSASRFDRKSNKRKKKLRMTSECLPSEPVRSFDGSAFNHASAESSVDDLRKRPSMEIRQYMSASDDDLYKSAFVSAATRSSIRKSRRQATELGSINVRLSAMDLTTGQPFFDGKSGIAVESDSYTEALSAPLKPYRKKKLVKRMAIDPCPPVGKHYYDDSTTPNMGMDVDGPTDARLHINCGMNLATVNEGSLASFIACQACTCPTVSGSDRRDSGIGRISSAGNCVEFDAVSETSLSSGESEGLYTNDEGREGDDEQSDWFLEDPLVVHSKTQANDSLTTRNASPENVCMGIPIPFTKPSGKRVSSPLFRSDTPTPTMSGPESSSTQQPQTPSVPESSDTDMSQGSWCYRRPCDASGATRMALRRSAAKGSKAAFVHAMSKKINRFIDDRMQSELIFGPLQKREQTEILKLASFYQLDVRYKSKRRRHGLVLVKTRFATAKGSGKPKL